MPTARLYSDDLLEPVSPGEPAGADMRWTPEWDRIKEARRSDDDLQLGKWAKKERKLADWVVVERLAADMLRSLSKDLQIALWLTEAGTKLHGFPGLRDGFRITSELMVRYWATGLYPSMEDGPEDRSGPFDWLNNKLVDSITAIPITVRDGDRNYSLIDLKDARITGSEAGWKTADGIDTTKKKAYEAALAGGHISLDLFDRAVVDTKRDAYEELNADFQQAYQEFQSLEKVVDEKFGDAAPSLSLCRGALNDLRQEFADIMEKKRLAEPDERAPADKAQPEGASTEAANPGNFQAAPPAPDQPPGFSVVPSVSWQEAETLIRSGQVDKGLEKMIGLSAKETTGRSRFQRKLLLAEACLSSKRERLARSILEELAEQIDKMQLEHWESSELVASVWSRLYTLYKQQDNSTDTDRATKLYERLCRLDPWQALNCGEG